MIIEKKLIINSGMLNTFGMPACPAQEISIDNQAAPNSYFMELKINHRKWGYTPTLRE
jgi:hypothetical protein